MPVVPGARIGPYEVLALIGSGGMGDVYRARDTQLNRNVALKVLPHAFAGDPDRLARLKREAQVLAGLNHPNIAAIYGFEQADDVSALVLELVEGPTLADRIKQGAIPIAEMLPIARQMAEALEAAHAHSIVHRDLKPANIKLRPDGVVKVLDFGLAKAIEPIAGGVAEATVSPTITTPALTQMGVLLGTAAYMSPEQAKGKPLDKRTDLWAFGCVMYEMISGERAFAGEDVSDTLAAVLRDEPDWAACPTQMPLAVRRVIRRCLEKDRNRRLDSAAVARLEIDEALSGPADEGSHAAAQTRPLRRLAWAVAVVVAGATVWALRPASAPSPPLMRFTIPLPPGNEFSNTGVQLVALSSDGRRMVYVANQRLYLRAMEALEATPMRGTEPVATSSNDGRGGATTTNAGRNPFFSPDGQWVGFWQDGQLKKVSISGGAPIALCAAENPWGASWTSDNTILYGQGEENNAGIWRVSGDGGKPEQLVKIEAGQIAQSPQMLPGRGAILFTLARRNDQASAQIVVQSLDTGVRHVVVEHGVDARYVPTGHLVYALDGTLVAAPFDVSRLAVTRGAVPLVDDVAGNVDVHFATSDQGTLAYVPRDAVSFGSVPQRLLVWVDRQGRESPIKAPPRGYLYPRMSPDGARVALEVREQTGDIWIWDISRETLSRLTLEPTFDQYAVWTPDAQWVIFASSETGGPASQRNLFRRAADGAGTAERLLQGTTAQFPSAVTPDGKALIFRVQTPPARIGTPAGTDLLLLPLEGERRARPLVQTPFDELNGEVSPNGRWLAYESNESGREEIYVRPFPNVDAGKRQVSTSGGAQPLWARNGKELFYVRTAELMRVPVTTDGTFGAGVPTKLFDAPQLTPPLGGGLGRMYDVTPDGQRFLMTKAVKSDDTHVPLPRIIVVHNWFEELRQRVPAK